MLSNIGKPVNETGKLLHVANDIPEQTISDELRTFLDAPKLINHRGASVVRSVFHPFFHANCEWCNCTTTQQHHYPIPKSKGGTETVSVCANCHFEFHQMVGVPTYEPTQALIAFFETPLSKAYKMGGV